MVEHQYVFVLSKNILIVEKPLGFLFEYLF